MAAFWGEFIGMLLLVLLGNGVVAATSLKTSKAEGSGWIAIALGWGFAVTVAVYASGFLSGAHLNPAVTIALAFNGDFPWSSVFSYILAQMLGAMVGQILVYLNYYKQYEATRDAATILGTFSTAPAIRSTLWNLVSEAIGTAVLVIIVLSMGPNNLSSGLGAMVVGVVVTSIGFSLGGATGYAINPARDLGPRIVHQFLPIPGKGDSDWGYAWIPVVGPIVGGILGALFYQLILNLM